MTGIVRAVVAAGVEAGADDAPQVFDAALGDGVEQLVDELLSMLKLLISDQQRRIELERADAARMALEMAADKLEAVHTNDLYKRAFNKAAKMLRQ